MTAFLTWLASTAWPVAWAGLTVLFLFLASLTPKRSKRRHVLSLCAGVSAGLFAWQLQQ